MAGLYPDYVNYEFLTDLFDDPQIATALNPPAPQPPESAMPVPNTYDLPPEIGMKPTMIRATPPTPTTPSLARPGESRPPMAPPGYGTPDYAASQQLFPGMPLGPPISRPGKFVPPKRNRVAELGGWKGIMGGLIGGALAGATTPSHPGSGGTILDAFRGMQAGQNYGLNRDLMAYQMGRQRAEDARKAEADRRDAENDAANRELHRAQMERYKAEAEERRAKANSYEVQLAHERDEAYKRGDEAAIQAIEKKIERYKRAEKTERADKYSFHDGIILNEGTGGYQTIPGYQKPSTTVTPETRLASTIKIVRQLKKIPDTTPDSEVMDLYGKLSDEEKGFVATMLSGRAPTPQRGWAPTVQVDDQGNLTGINATPGPNGTVTWATAPLGAGGKTKTTPAERPKTAAMQRLEDQKTAGIWAAKIQDDARAWLRKNKEGGKFTDAEVMDLALSNANDYSYYPDAYPYLGEIEKIIRAGAASQAGTRAKVANAGPPPVEGQGGSGGDTTTTTTTTTSGGRGTAGQPKPAPKPKQGKPPQVTISEQQVRTVYDRFKHKHPEWKTIDDARRYLEAADYKVQ